MRHRDRQTDRQTETEPRRDRKTETDRLLKRPSTMMVNQREREV